MDRIEDIAEHINDMTISQGSHKRCTFDFLDLLNHAAVLIDCIYEIARLFDVKMSGYEDSHDVFNQTGNDGTATDKMYFEYLRSICSVHPFETNRHPKFQESAFECCPYVYWNDNWPNKNGDLCAQIYLDKTGWKHYKTLPIKMNEIILYIQKMYSAIEDTIIPGIEAFQEAYREKHRARKLKTKESFKNYIDYLRYLGKEADIRFGEDEDFYIESTCRFFEVSFNHPKNKRLLEKYRNVLELAISYYHNSLQNVSFEGYENNGILFSEPNYETTLFNLVLSLESNSKLSLKYGYELSKAYELLSDSASSYYAQTVLETARPFLEQYVCLDESNSNLEYYVLIQLAQYADCLRNKNLLNQNIPNELLYRFRRLKSSGWEKLHRPMRRKTSKYSIEEFEKFLSEYGNQDDASLF